MLPLIFILAATGFCIATYTYFLEQKVKKNANYKAACDLSDRISCTKPILSPYGKIFFVSNATAGIIFYALVWLLAIFNAVHLLFVAAIGACLASLVLAYLLYVKIKAICLLCTALYVINFLILGLTAYKLFV